MQDSVLYIVGAFLDACGKRNYRTERYISYKVLCTTMLAGIWASYRHYNVGQLQYHAQHATGT